MSGEKTEKRTIDHALFTYDLPGGGQGTAMRGDTVELLAHDVERGEKHAAFTDKVGQAPEPKGSELPDFPVEGTEAEQDAWVAAGTVQEIVDAVNAQPEIADAVIEAELRRDDAARSTLLDSLSKLTAAKS